MRKQIHPQFGLPPDLRGFQIYPLRESRGHDLSHHHRFIELHYCEMGHGFIQIGSARYPLKPGLVTLLYAPIPHRIYSSVRSIYRRKVIHFPIALPAVSLDDLGDILPIMPTISSPCLQFLLKSKELEKLSNLLTRGYHECNRWHQESRVNISQTLSEIILILKNTKPFIPKLSTEEITPYERLLAYKVESLIENYDGDTLQVSTLSYHLGVSPGHIRRVYAKVRQNSLRSFLLTMKLVRAEASLRNGRTVTEAAMTGLYTHVGNFSRTFKNHMGVSPKVYQSWLEAIP